MQREGTAIEIQLGTLETGLLSQRTPREGKERQESENSRVEGMGMSCKIMFH